MICVICKEPIINGGFSFAHENAAGFLEGRYNIKEHSDCALDKWYPNGFLAGPGFKTVEEFARAEFWTHFLSIGDDNVDSSPNN